MTKKSISVIIPTHNPQAHNLSRVLASLASQTLHKDFWELIVVDNASTVLVILPQPWLAQAKLVQEKSLGLMQARLRGIQEAQGDLLIWVDDDNVLKPDYLELALEAFRINPCLGAAGGKSLPEYERTPPDWFTTNLAPLGCRDLGEQSLLMNWDAERPDYPSAAPIGAGLVIRRMAMVRWAEAVRTDPRRQQLGRRGTQLTSGEDNDICLTLLRAGWQLAYLPELSLTHLITAGRLQPDYLARIGRVSFRDFIWVLDMHGVRIWRPIAGWTLPLRALRAYITFRAWRGPAAYIRWQSAIGQFEGRARLIWK